MCMMILAAPKSLNVVALPDEILEQAMHEFGKYTDVLATFRCDSQQMAQPFSAAAREYSKAAISGVLALIRMDL